MRYAQTPLACFDPLAQGSRCLLPADTAREAKRQKRDNKDDTRERKKKGRKEGKEKKHKHKKHKEGAKKRKKDKKRAKKEARSRGHPAETAASSFLKAGSSGAVGSPSGGEPLFDFQRPEAASRPSPSHPSLTQTESPAAASRSRDRGQASEEGGYSAGAGAVKRKSMVPMSKAGTCARVRAVSCTPLYARVPRTHEEMISR